METSSLNVTKSHCPKCGPDRNTSVQGTCHRGYSENDCDEYGNVLNGIDWTITYSILECAGCNTVFCQREFWSSEDDYASSTSDRITYWPSSAGGKLPDWTLEIDWTLREILVEAYTALNNEMPILAAIGVRTAIDRATELLGIDPALKFVEKPDALSNSGSLSAKDRATLDIVINAGHAAAHRGWKPNKKQLAVMIAVLESFLHKEFILNPDPRIAKLSATIPPAPKRRKP
jgi:hypothetical protein